MGETERTTDNLSRLLELGFEQARDGPVITEDVRIDRRTHRVTATCGAMATHVSITALGPSRDRLDHAIGRAYEEMERLITIFSRHQPDTALSELNDAGWLRGPPPELSQVVEKAVGFHDFTLGTFDVSVAPLLDLYKRRLRGGGTPPTDAEVREARALVGVSGIVRRDHELRLGRSGMRLTLDGIAKGYIVDRMAAVLEQRSVGNFLIDAGGDIRSRGRKEGGQCWLVAVQDPMKRGAFPDVLHLGNAAVATSGSYERYYDAGRRYHHIVDAASGQSPTSCASVSVVAGSTMLADVLATSVFIMGPDRGTTFVESHAGCECLIIDGSGREVRSRGWKSAAPAPPSSPFDQDPTE